MSDISISAIFTAIVPVFLTCAIGYFFRKKSWVDSTIQTGLMRLVIWVFTPSLIIDRVLGNPLLMNIGVVAKVIAAGLICTTIGIIVAIYFARFFGIQEKQRRRIFGFCCGVFNYGYIALPIGIALCPPDTIGMMLLFNSSIEVAVWSIGVTIINGSVRPKELMKSIINPIFLAMFFCLACNFSGIAEYIPAWVFSTTKSLGACMIPCGILLVGMALPVLMNGFRLRDEPLVSMGALSMRLVLIPAMMTASALFIPAVPQDLRYILIIQSGMPTAMLPIVIVQFYGGDARLALRIVLATSVVCIITLPFWIKTGFWLLDRFQ